MKKNKNKKIKIKNKKKPHSFKSDENNHFQNYMWFFLFLFICESFQQQQPKDCHLLFVTSKIYPPTKFKRNLEEGDDECSDLAKATDTLSLVKQRINRMNQT